MHWLSSLVLILQLLSALTIIVLVLLQHGKGADMGSAFGSGSSGSLFGASGAANFLSRTTKWAAVVFFASTAAMAYMGAHRVNQKESNGATGVMDSIDLPASAVKESSKDIPTLKLPAQTASGTQAVSTPTKASGSAVFPATNVIPK